MATHKQYSYIPIGRCECGRCGDTWTYPQYDYAPVAKYESEQVEILCPDCNAVASTFYRKPGLDKAPAKPDKAFIGQAVQVKRIVAWVGYAKNAGTVLWTQKEENEKCAQVLAREVKISIEKATDLLRTRNSYYDWLESAIRNRARYETLGKAFKAQPMLADRGLWFLDKSLDVQIDGVLRCVTGKRDSGSACGGSFDDYDPPTLYNQVHHQLYYCNHSETHQRVLIYPGDIGGVG